MNKEDEKRILQCVKNIAKTNNYKAVSNCIYKTDCNWVIYAVVGVRRIDDNYSLEFRWCIKTIELDDIFWDIFHMSENKKERFSLRINGAFCCPSYVFNETAYVIESTEKIMNDMEDIFTENIEFINDYVKHIRMEYSDFNSYIVSQKADDLTKVLAQILMGNYEDAYRFVRNELKHGESGGFENGGKDIYEYICKYCRRKRKKTHRLFGFLSS